MLRSLSNLTYPGHARLATDRRLLEGDNWNCGCDGANRDEHLTLEPRDPPLGTRQNYTKVSDRFWPILLKNSFYGTKRQCSRNSTS
jgi:hypothetical protein